MRLYGIVGAGGFGREVMPVANDMLVQQHSKENFEVVFVVEYGELSPINGYRVMSSEQYLGNINEKYFNVAISDHQARERIARKFQAAGAVPFSIRARNSICMDNNQIDEGAIICPFATVTSNAQIGKFFHANIYSYVAHDCRIGNFVTFAPGVHCNGRVIVEDYAYVGTGAVIREGTESAPIVIGRNAIVGMGAVVTKNVPPFATVVGNPASPLVKARG